MWKRLDACSLANTWLLWEDSEKVMMMFVTSSLSLLPCFQEKYDKLVNEQSSLNKNLQQLQDDNQRDTETRIQVTIK